MNLSISPFMILSALGMGIASAYLAYKRDKNPYIWFAVGFLFGLIGVFALFFTAGQKKAAPRPPETEPVYTIQGPTDKFWYYLDPTHQQQGPMSRDSLTTAWKEGKVNLATYVWHEEMSDWKQLKETLKLEN
jgi:hypothetical protein